MAADSSSAAPKSRLDALRGTPFTKMTGSGNDFVVFDSREVSRELVEAPEVIQAICNRHNGIGADGVVILEPRWATTPPDNQPPNTLREVPDTLREHPEAPREHPDASHVHPHSILLKYFNSDGSMGELCGNATLCSTTLCVAVDLAPSDAVILETDAGQVQARLIAGEPQIDLAPVNEVRLELSQIPLASGESRMGFARVGVPHVVIVTRSLAAVALAERGRSIRQHDSLLPDGANVNWVGALADGRWAYRTYERGVEGETLACGTGAVAAAILLVEWQLASWPVRLVTRSGQEVQVNLRARSASSTISSVGESGGVRVENGAQQWSPSLRGEGRVVFRGTIADLR